jgi:hypothetical protein
MNIELTIDQAAEVVLSSLKEDLKMIKDNIKELKEKKKTRDLFINEIGDLEYDLNLKKALKVVLEYYGVHLEKKC